MSNLNVRELDLELDKNNLIEGAFKVAKLLRHNWVFNKMSFQIFSEGRTNQLVGVHYDKDEKDTILVRVNGENTDKIIDREEEIKIMQFFHTLGLSSKVYARFRNGLAYQYLSGKILNEKTCYDEKVFPLVAEKMATFHLQLNSYQKCCADGELLQTFLWDKIKLFLASYNNGQSCDDETIDYLQQQRCGQQLPSKTNLTKELEWLVQHLDKFNNPIVFCHNDLLLANVLYDEKMSIVHFIDFEYAGPNYQAYDIANHFSEFSGTIGWSYSYPDENYRRQWIQAYLKVYYNCSYVDQLKVAKLLEEVEHFRLASHFFCGAWGLYQLSNSALDVDFTEYSVLRFDEYYRVKNMLFASSLL